MTRRCTIEGCMRNYHCCGLCGAHYQKLRRYGSPRYKKAPVKKRCQIIGCEQRHHSQGFCSTHLYRVKHFGDPNYGRNDLWTEKEDEIVTRNIEQPEKYIQKALSEEGFNRSQTAIKQRIWRMRLRSERDCYNLTTIANLLGVDFRTAQRWVRKGWLRSERRRDDRRENQGGSVLLIKPKDVVRFVKRFPSAFSLKKVDQIWFLDLVFEGKLESHIDKNAARTVSQRQMERNEFGD